MSNFTFVNLSSLIGCVVVCVVDCVVVDCVAVDCVVVDCVVDCIAGRFVVSRK